MWRLAVTDINQWKLAKNLSGSIVHFPDFMVLIKFRSIPTTFVHVCKSCLNWTELKSIIQHLYLRHTIIASFFLKENHVQWSWALWHLIPGPWLSYLIQTVHWFIVTIVRLGLPDKLIWIDRFQNAYWAQKSLIAIQKRIVPGRKRMALLTRLVYNNRIIP